MYSGMILIIITIILSIIIFLLSSSMKLFEKEKMSPFECGFNMMSTSGISFSMPFFILSLMFLLFDVEILLLCMNPMSMQSSLNINLVMNFTVMIVLVTTLYEWLAGMLTWK